MKSYLSLLYMILFVCGDKEFVEILVVTKYYFIS